MWNLQLVFEVIAERIPLPQSIVRMEFYFAYTSSKYCKYIGKGESALFFKHDFLK